MVPAPWDTQVFTTLHDRIGKLMTSNWQSGNKGVDLGWSTQWFDPSLYAYMYIHKVSIFTWPLGKPYNFYHIWSLIMNFKYLKILKSFQNFETDGFEDWRLKNYRRWVVSNLQTLIESYIHMYTQPDCMQHVCWFGKGSQKVWRLLEAQPTGSHWFGNIPLGPGGSAHSGTNFQWNFVFCVQIVLDNISLCLCIYIYIYIYRGRTGVRAVVVKCIFMFFLLSLSRSFSLSLSR